MSSFFSLFGPGDFWIYKICDSLSYVPVSHENRFVPIAIFQGGLEICVISETKDLYSELESLGRVLSVMDFTFTCRYSRDLEKTEDGNSIFFSKKWRQSPLFETGF